MATIFVFILLNNVGGSKVKDQQVTDGRPSRPPSVIIASSSKNKDNIIVGFGNASISGTYLLYLS